MWKGSAGERVGKGGGVVLLLLLHKLRTEQAHPVHSPLLVFPEGGKTLLIEKALLSVFSFLLRGAVSAVLWMPSEAPDL